MLKKLFTPNWQSDDQNTRQKALDETTDPRVISSMAKCDPSPELRYAALLKLIDTDTLQDMLEHANQAEDWLRIAFQLHSIAPQLDILVRQFRLSAKNWDMRSTLDILGAQMHSDLAHQLLLASEAPELHYEIAASNLNIDVRLAAIGQIETTEGLLRLLKNTTQKPILQACRVRVEAIRAQHKHIAQTHRQAHELLAEMQQLANRSTQDTFYQSKLDRLERRWLEVDMQALASEMPSTAADDDIPPTSNSTTEISDYVAIQQSFEEARKACKAQLAALQYAHSVEAEKQQQLTRQSEICQHLNLLLTDVKSPSLTTLQLQQLESDTDNSVAAWRQSVSQQDPSETNNARSINLQQQIADQCGNWRRLERLGQPLDELFTELPLQHYGPQQQWIKKWRRLLSSIAWPPNQMLPVVLEERLKIATAIESLHIEVQAEERKKANVIRQKIVLLQRHCQNRDLAAANKLADYLTANITAGHDDFTAGLQRKYDTVQTQLAELRDWHLFAITPKKEGLCSAMDELCSDQLAPLDRAAAIKDLQTQWRQLTASHAIGNDPLWERFKAAEKIAYEPCQGYYDEQNRIQAANYQQREALIAGIDNLLDIVTVKTSSQGAESSAEVDVVAAIDWKDINQKLSKIQRDWQQIPPANEKKRRRQQARYEAKNGKLHQLLLATKQQNLQFRHELVASAEKLLSDDSVEHAIREARTLQQQWKTAGITFFKADREQWQLFRNAIDQIFTKRDQAQRSHASGLRDGADRLIDLNNKIEQLCKLPDSNLKASYTDFQQLRQSWDADTELPHDSAKKLLQRFDKSCDKYRKHYAGLSKRLQRDAHIALIRGAEMLADAEADFLTSSDASIDEEVLEPLREAIAKLQCSTQGRTRLSKRLDQLAQCNSPQVNQAGTEELQNLALKNEILLGIESPKSFSSQRMSLQLERLKNGLGSAISSSNHRAKVLESFDVWITVGFLPESSRQPLEERRRKIFKAVGL